MIVVHMMNMFKKYMKEKNQERLDKDTFIDYDGKRKFKVFIHRHWYGGFHVETNPDWLRYSHNEWLKENKPYLDKLKEKNKQ